MRRIRLFLVVTVSIMLTLLLGTVAMASPKTMPDGNVFDADFYATMYPDVVAALGKDESVLYYHYLTFGQKEGRLATIPAAQNLPTTKAKWEYTEAELIDQAIASCIKPGMNPLDMARAVDDYLCRNVSYDDSATRYSTFDTLAYGTAICQGYSNAFWKIMNKLGVPTDYVSGTANGGRHAWNRCNFGGVYLYTDVTWNDSLGSKKYLLLTEEQMGKDHVMMEINRQNRVM